MRTKNLFGTEKPIIALLHLDALPGEPAFEGSLEAVSAVDQRKILEADPLKDTDAAGRKTAAPAPDPGAAAGTKASGRKRNASPDVPDGSPEAKND